MGLKFRSRLPGVIASGLTVAVSAVWAFWGTAEMYFEGWWGSWGVRLAYLIPAGVTLLLSLAALTWPKVGGWLLIVIGGGFTLWWWLPAALRGELTWARVGAQFPVSGILVLVGLLFLLEGRYRQRRVDAGWLPAKNWWLRNLRYVLAIGLPFLVALIVSAYNLPTVLAREDDGERGARLIEGSGVTLVWAPQGPGWNWQQPWGGYPSWDSLAYYGVQPVGLVDKPVEKVQHAGERDMQAIGLCRYLSADGSVLTATPQDIWRMPTVGEIVASLALHGENAWCEWHGEVGRADCALSPDKETPLWAPDEPPVYYWTANAHDDENAYYVSYLAYVQRQPKDWGNPRHGYRCVREP